jgi:hypothetical protein
VAVQMKPFRLLGPLKEVLKLRGCVFVSDEDLKAAVVQRFPQKLRELFVERAHRLVHLLAACLKVHENIFNRPLIYCTKQYSDAFQLNNV